MWDLRHDSKATAHNSAQAFFVASSYTGRCSSEIVAQSVDLRCGLL